MEDYFIKVLEKLTIVIEGQKKTNDLLAKLGSEKATRKSIDKIFEPSKESYSLEEVKPLVERIKQKDLNESQTGFLESVFGFAIKYGKVSEKQYQSLQKML